MAAIATAVCRHHVGARRLGRPIAPGGSPCLTVDCRPACPLHVPFELAVIRITPACLEILAHGGEALEG